jgi:hypothetical protein
MHLPTALVAIGATVASALPQVEIKGNQFYFAGNGSEFKVRGLAYQPGGQAAFKGDGDDKHDPLSTPDLCRRDVGLMQSLGVNVARVYNLHADLDHDECVSLFNDAGIYLMLDVNSPLVNSHINKEDPKSTYHAGYIQNIYRVVDAFKGFDNVIGFFSGNEIIDTLEHVEKNTVYLRAVVRDLRRYLMKHSRRFIAVGYAATDTRSSSGAGLNSVTDLWDFLRCNSGEEDNAARSDFFAVNIYSWCNDATFDQSGYPTLIDDFKDTNLPVFWSEHGCIEGNRTFEEVPAMYGRDDMIKTFAGGVVFEYSNEENGYGLVNVTAKDNSITLLGDFKELSQKYDSVDWNKIRNIKKDDIDAKAAPMCKDIKFRDDSFPSDFKKVPEFPKDAERYLEKGSGLEIQGTGKLIKGVKSENTKYKIYEMSGKEKKDVTKNFGLNKVKDAEVSDAPDRAEDKNEPGANGGDDEGSAAGFVPSAIAAMVPLVAGLFLF